MVGKILEIPFIKEGQHTNIYINIIKNTRIFSIVENFLIFTYLTEARYGVGVT